MPGFTIHTIIAKEYVKKHPNEISDEKEFINGTIAPDLTTDKNTTHYGIWERLIVITNLDKMLEDPKVDITKDYWKGYFLHLYVDNQFYNNYFKIADYDINIDDFPKEIRKYMRSIYSIEKPKYIDYSKLKNMIKELSEINLKDEIKKCK